MVCCIILDYFETVATLADFLKTASTFLRRCPKAIHCGSTFAKRVPIPQAGDRMHSSTGILKVERSASEVLQISSTIFSG